MGPKRRRYGRDTVTDAWTILARAYAVTPTDAGVAICHVRRSLFMTHGDKADASGLEDIHSIHEG